MNIGPPTDNGWSPIDLRAPGARATAPAAPAASAPPAPGTRPGVTVTSSVADLSAAGEPELDMQKVEQMRQAIAEGRFTIRPELIADRLIADATALLAPRPAAAR